VTNAPIFLNVVQAHSSSSFAGGLSVARTDNHQYENTPKNKKKKINFSKAKRLVRWKPGLSSSWARDRSTVYMVPQPRLNQQKRRIRWCNNALLLAADYYRQLEASFLDVPAGSMWRMVGSVPDGPILSGKRTAHTPEQPKKDFSITV